MSFREDLRYPRRWFSRIARPQQEALLMHPLESRFRGGAPQLALLSALLLLSSVLSFAVPATASDTPAPHSVTVAGSLQSELGCPDDWQPGCATTHLTFS